ncbi:MAG TPA: mannose-1-phosphate guanylyltransferase [Candidatus Sulfotelmatobacter sp.]|nr:mannose-1-phosphate guanylyltransferase [Candidatus Sulfotelmatobacter sp.]
MSDELRLSRLYAVILAGGSGERFWPLSTARQPKQFPPLLDGRSFFQHTVDRMVSLVGLERVLVASRRDLMPMIREQVPELPPENCLLEPTGRDTAAAIGLAACVVERRDAGAWMLVAPSDHFIRPIHAFEETVRHGLALLERREGLVTIGIPPTGPETGYGYILAGEPVPEYSVALRCDRFTEKPDRGTAERFLQDGRYYWNSGIFLWMPATFLKALARHLPGHRAGLEEIRKALGTPDEGAVLDRVFPTLPKISVDVGVLERAAEVFMVPASFSWDDVGTWSALGRTLPKDDQGNATVGRHVGRDTSGCVIYATTRPVGTIGLKDVIVVETAEGVLVCPISRAQEVKELLRAMLEGTQ